MHAIMPLGCYSNVKSVYSYKKKEIVLTECVNLF